MNEDRHLLAVYFEHAW